jgi:hypothetical protein
MKHRWLDPRPLQRSWMQAAAAGALASCWCAAAAQGLTIDARQFGMASAQVPGGRDLTGLNVAYASMPPRPGAHGVVVPVPLGLVDLALHFPTVDPDDPDFNAMRLVNLSLNPPFFLELKEPDPLDGDISIYVARNEFSVEFEEAARLLPQKPLEVAAVSSTPLASLGLRGVRAYMAPFLYTRGEVALDDALHGVLTRGEALLPNSEYVTRAGGEAAGGVAFNFGYSRAIRADSRGNGLYAGAMAKYVLGFAMGNADSRFALATSDTIFGGSTPMQIDFNSLTRYSNGIGNGYGFDVGLGYRQGAIDVGVGLRDVGTRIRWNRTTVEAAHLDDATSDVIVETLESGLSYTQTIPMQTTVNVGWSRGALAVAADVTSTKFATLLHLGAERRFGLLALRGGLLLDEDTRVQYACGAGVGMSRLWLDVGLQTHNHTFTGEQGLLLGTSIAFR